MTTRAQLPICIRIHHVQSRAEYKRLLAARTVTAQPLPVVVRPACSATDGDALARRRAEAPERAP
eukprot:5000054-Prymnesium_polylepis.1